MAIDLSGPELAESLAREFLTRIWGENSDLQAIDELMTEDYQIFSNFVASNGQRPSRERGHELADRTRIS